MRFNRGFTLIELVVCMAIFGIVVSAAYGFMLAGADSFFSINSGINIQISSDLAINQLSDYTMDCNTAIAFKSDSVNETYSLIIINKDPEPNASGDTTYKVNVFEQRDECIYFGSSEAFLADDGTFLYSCTASDLLAEGVQEESFNVIFTHVDDSTSAISANITASFESRNQTLEAERTVYLRNHPKIITTP